MIYRCQGFFVRWIGKKPSRCLGDRRGSVGGLAMPHFIGTVVRNQAINQQRTRQTEESSELLTSLLKGGSEPLGPCTTSEAASTTHKTSANHFANHELTTNQPFTDLHQQPSTKPPPISPSPALRPCIRTHLHPSLLLGADGSSHHWWLLRTGRPRHAIVHFHVDLPKGVNG